MQNIWRDKHMGYRKNKNKVKKILIASATSTFAVCAVIGAVLTSEGKKSSNNETAKYVDLNETTSNKNKRFNDVVIEELNGDKDKKEAQSEKINQDSIGGETTANKKNTVNQEETTVNKKDMVNQEETTSQSETIDQNIQPAAVLPETPEIKKQVIWPVEGDILIDYDMDNLVYFKTIDKYKCSDAICIQAEQGTPVYSGADGTIIEMDECDEYGKYMTVDIGDGYKITYGQLDNIPVSSGLTIKKGDLIGYVAKATRFYALEGDNLYVKMTKNGELVDPTDFLNYE